MLSLILCLPCPREGWLQHWRAPDSHKHPDLPEMPALPTWEPLRASESLRCSVDTGQSIDKDPGGVMGRPWSDTHSDTYERQFTDHTIERSF